jgi:hypothetical protein
MLFTASWTTLHRASTYAELPVQPVRISRGVPKFWPAAADFPAIPELMPSGWVFAVAKTDPERARRGYRHGIHILGHELLSALIAEAVSDDPRPACLLCFEPDVHDCHRGQVAAVWEQWTGEPIRDLSFMFNLSTGEPALVTEINDEKEH